MDNGPNYRHLQSLTIMDISYDPDNNSGTTLPCTINAPLLTEVRFNDIVSKKLMSLWQDFGDLQVVNTLLSSVVFSAYLMNPSKVSNLMTLTLLHNHMTTISARERIPLPALQTLTIIISDPVPEVPAEEFYSRLHTPELKVVGFQRQNFFTSPEEPWKVLLALLRNNGQRVHTLSLAGLQIPHAEGRTFWTLLPALERLKLLSQCSAPLWTLNEEGSGTLCPNLLYIEANSNELDAVNAGKCIASRIRGANNPVNAQIVVFATVDNYASPAVAEGRIAELKRQLGEHSGIISRELRDKSWWY